MSEHDCKYETRKVSQTLRVWMKETMQLMEIKRMFKIVLRWWWLGAIPVIVVALYLGLTYRPPGTTYQVVMRFTTGGEPAGLSTDYDRYYAWLASEYIANGLADIANTGAFAEAVARRAADRGAEIDPNALRGAVVSDNEQSILVIYLTWPDPAQIVAVAEALSAELTQNGAAYYPQMRDIGLFAQQMDPPAPAALPPSLRAQLLGPGMRLLFAAAVGLGLIFLVHYLDPMVRERAEVEALALPVLVSIPTRRRFPFSLFTTLPLPVSIRAPIKKRTG